MSVWKQLPEWNLLKWRPFLQNNICAKCSGSIRNNRSTSRSVLATVRKACGIPSTNLTQLRQITGYIGEIPWLPCKIVITSYIWKYLTANHHVDGILLGYDWSLATPTIGSLGWPENLSKTPVICCGHQIMRKIMTIHWNWKPDIFTYVCKYNCIYILKIYIYVCMYINIHIYIAKTNRVMYYE
jgi:hypothetical protein